ncbi:hypothetical protein MMC13_001652, partial [Lambiella insularis]|nr:hypothetical protein [Lambiella insularis]
MSATRLPFLYPHLFKSPRLSNTHIPFRPPACNASAAQNREFHKTNRRCQETYAQRYGPANDPQPPPSIPQKPQDRQLPRLPVNTATKSGPAAKEEIKVNSTSAEQEENRSSESEANVAMLGTPDPMQTTEKEKARRSAAKDAQESHPKENIRGPRHDAISDPLKTVLHIEAPTSKKSNEHKSHLHAPPYVHHFDTYTLVKDLVKGGFTQDQSITIMKAVRSLLAVNLDVAREELVSKSDIENETYLFRAACSELRTEIQNARRSSSDKMRSERAHLQHEVDILNQKLTQDSATLKDDLKGMFNDRKMAVRMEQRAMDSAIQELNYKITVALNSDSRGEVEGLRWVLTRRAAMAIAGMA